MSENVVMTSQPSEYWGGQCEEMSMTVVLWRFADVLFWSDSPYVRVRLSYLIGLQETNAIKGNPLSLYLYISIVNTRYAYIS